jgi:hypothetical protein
MKRKLVLASLVLILAFALPVSAFAGGLQEGRVVFGGTYTLHDGETLDGDLAVLGGAAILEQGSTVDGDVIILGGNLEAKGEINGNLVVIGGNANLGPNTVVRGDAITFGGNVNTGNARIEGDQVSGEGLDFPLDFGWGRDFDIPLRTVTGFRVSTQARVLGYLFQCFMLAALAVLVVIFWPNPTGRVASAVVDQPVVAGGLGLLTIIVAPILLILLMITICLIPVSILGFILLVIAAVFGWVALGLEVGQRLAKALNQEYQPVVAAGLGTLVLSLVVNGIAFIPCVGWLAPFMVAALGLGGVLLTRFGAQAYIASTQAAPPPDEALLVEVPPTDEPEEETAS